MESGLVRKVICSAARGQGKDAVRRSSSCGRPAERARLPAAGDIRRMHPRGRCRHPAFYTPVGLGTELTRGKEVRRFGERDYVLEEAIKGELALVRADTADRYGNLTFRYAQVNFGLVMATAAKLVVAEVRATVDEPIPHERVQLPGTYVDRVVVAAAG